MYYMQACCYNSAHIQVLRAVGYLHFFVNNFSICFCNYLFSNIRSDEFCLFSHDQSAIMSSLRSCRQPVYHSKTGESHSVLFPTTQQLNLPACSPHCPINAERQQFERDWIDPTRNQIRFCSSRGERSYH